MFVNGSETLSPYALLSSIQPRMCAANVSLEAFYIVVSARTGPTGSDRHVVSGVSLSYCDEFIENWSGFRQPFTPPPASPPWRRSPPQPPPQPPPMQQHWPVASRSATRLGAVSFGTAFACTFGLLLLIAMAVPLYRSVHRKQRAACKAAAVPGSDEAWLLSAPPTKLVAVMSDDDAERQSTVFDVFLSYRRADTLIIDSIHDKLRLAGLRVFKDVDGFMAEQQVFDAQLVRAPALCA